MAVIRYGNSDYNKLLEILIYSLLGCVVIGLLAFTPALVCLTLYLLKLINSEVLNTKMLLSQLQSYYTASTACG